MERDLMTFNGPAGAVFCFFLPEGIYTGFLNFDVYKQSKSNEVPWIWWDEDGMMGSDGGGGTSQDTNCSDVWLGFLGYVFGFHDVGNGARGSAPKNQITKK